MKALWIPALFILVLIADGIVFATNPLHVPDGNLPARLLGLQSFKELDPSMEPTIPENKSLVVSAWPYLNSAPRVGDIIAFSYPPDPTQADLKRIIAAAGSTVEIRNSTVLIDGKPVAEPYVHGVIRNWNVPRSMAPVRVPPNSFFVMGDNRDRSEDSRHWGSVARTQIIGKLWF